MSVRWVRIPRGLLVGALGLSVLLTACQPEQRPVPGTVRNITPKTGSASASASVSASVSGIVPPSAGAGGATSVSADVTKGDGVYTPVSGVAIYQLISLDAAEISQLTNAVNEGRPLPAQEILAIYESPKHAQIGENRRPLRNFARNEARANDFPDAAQFYNSPTFLDDLVMDGINGTGTAANYSPAERRQVIQKGVTRILYHWSFQQILAGEAKLRQGNVDPITGAPHNVDEAWAIYVGAEQDGKYPYSVASVAQSRENNYNRPDTLDKPLRQAFEKAKRAALENNVAGFEQAKAEIQSRFNAIFYLSTARYLNEAVKSAGAGNTDTAKVQLAEGLTYYRSIQPAVAKADASVDRAVVEFFQSDPSKLTTADRDRVLEALNRTASTLGLQQSDLVTPASFS